MSCDKHKAHPGRFAVGEVDQRENEWMMVDDDLPTLDAAKNLAQSLLDAGKPLLSYYIYNDQGVIGGPFPQGFAEG